MRNDRKECLIKVDEQTDFRKKHRGKTITMLLLFLMPIFLMFGAGTTQLFDSSFLNSNVSVKADEPKDKDDDKDKDKDKNDDDDDEDKESSSGEEPPDDNNESSSSGSDTSAWNDALNEVSGSAADDIFGGKSESNDGEEDDDGKPMEKQASFKYDVINEGQTKYLNAWSFMGSSNNSLWEKSNNSSWSISYDNLINNVDVNGGESGHGDKNAAAKAYKQSTRFAYAMQATGLDQPAKAGFDSTSLLTKAAGWVAQVSYFVLHSADKLFTVVLNVLSEIDPIQWALNGADSNSPALNKLAEFVHDGYDAFHNLGLGIIGMILAVTLGMAALGISVGTGSAQWNNGRQTNALVNTLLGLLKRFFIWIMLPVFGLFVYDSAVGSVQNMFKTQKNSVANYAVFGSLVDYNNWVMNSRLALPSDVSLKASFDSKKLNSLNHSQIMSINRHGAGIESLGSLQESINSNKDAFDLGFGDNNELNNDDLNNRANAVLRRWTDGSSVTASDYASNVDPYIRDAASKGDDKGDDKKDQAPDLKAELLKTKYSTDSSNTVSSTDNEGSFSGVANADTGTAKPGLDGNSNGSGGLSTLGTYAYMLTTATDSKISIANTDQLSNDVAQPEHRSAVLVGRGIEGVGNIVWALGMILGMTIIVVGYLFEVLKSIVQSLPGITMGTFWTALGSLSGGVQFISVIAGLVISLFGSAVMYQFAQVAFVALAETTDGFISGAFGNVVANTLTFGHFNNGAVQLAAAASSSTIHGVLNITFGALLLWFSMLLYHYRGVIVAALASAIEETANKIMMTFGTVTGSGSSGTRGAIMRSTNTQNSLGGGAGGGMLKTAAMGAAAAGAGAGLSSLANGKGNNSNKLAKASKEKASEKEKANSNAGNGASSANKRGDAAARSGMQNGQPQNMAAQNGMGDNVNDQDVNDNQDLNQDDANEMNDANANDMDNQDLAGDQNQIGDDLNDQDQDGNDLMDTANEQDLSDQNEDALNDEDQDNELGDQDNAQDLNNQDQAGDMQELGYSANDNALGDDVSDTDQDALQNENADNLDTDQSDQSQDQDLAQDQADTQLGDSIGDNSQQLDDATQDQDLGDNMGNSLSNDENNALGDADNSQQMDDASQQQQDLANNLGVGDNNTNLGDASNDLAQSTGDQNMDQLNGDQSSSQIGNQGDMDDRQSLGESSANDLSTNVPVNSSISANDVQSQMGDIQNANESANTANSLAQANPDNQTLNDQAQSANDQLSSLQDNAMESYNQQGVTESMPQSQWLGNSQDPVSVGTADHAMDSVYQAQNDLTQATKDYGSSSSQVEKAQGALSNARENAVKSGLSQHVVNDSQAVEAAHDSIAENTSNLMKGSWKPQSFGSANKSGHASSVAHLGNGSNGGREIGI